MCVCVFVRKRPVVGSCSFAKFVIRQVLALTDAVDLLKRSVDRKTRSNEADQAQFKNRDHEESHKLMVVFLWQLGLPKISVVLPQKSLGFPMVFSIVGTVLIEAVGGKIRLEVRVVLVMR